MSAGAPTNVAQKNLIDKVAQYVSKNGSQFENMMREKQRGNPEYAFLFPNGAYNKYYLSKVRSEQIAQKLTMQRDTVMSGSHKPSFNPQTQNKWNPTLKIGGFSNPGPGASWKPQETNPRQSGFAPHNSNPNPNFVADPQPATQSQIDELKAEYKKKKDNFDHKIRESESNLKAQKKSLATDRENSVDAVIEEKINFECSNDALKLDVNIEEFSRIMKPIIRHCTKEAIAAGKEWILRNATDSKTSELICKYIAGRVLSNNATFDMRLHTIYLINDVFHHAHKRENHLILEAFEEIIVPLWSVTKLRADKEIGERLVKLKDLWKNNRYFSLEERVENRFESHIVEYKQFRDALRDRYRSEVKQAEEEFDSQFKSYESQHGDYVKHADGVLKDLMAQIDEKKRAMDEWEKRAEQRRQNAMEAAKRNKEGLENFQKQLSERQQLNMQGQNTNFGPLGKPWDGSFEGLNPTRPYYNLPAGLMAAVIKLDTKPFSEVDPESLRLVPNIQPSKKLMDALDEFYRPIPPTAQIKDNWVVGCLDQFFDAKTEALKNASKRNSSDSENKSYEESSSKRRKSRFSSVR